MSQVSVTVGAASDFGVLAQLYTGWGYRGGIACADTVYVATTDRRRVGLVRRAHEEGVFMLRGMQVDPQMRRQGIGTRLLRALTDDLPPADCYSSPFRI